MMSYIAAVARKSLTRPPEVKNGKGEKTGYTVKGAYLVFFLFYLFINSLFDNADQCCMQ